MTKYAEQFKRDAEAVRDDLEDFRAVLVDANGVRWVGTKDTVGIDPSFAIDGQLGGYSFSVWICLADHPSAVAAPAARSLATVDGVPYEISNVYKPDPWTARVDLRTRN